MGSVPAAALAMAVAAPMGCSSSVEGWRRRVRRCLETDNLQAYLLLASTKLPAADEAGWLPLFQAIEWLHEAQVWLSRVVLACFQHAFITDAWDELLAMRLVAADQDRTETTATATTAVDDATSTSGNGATGIEPVRSDGAAVAVDESDPPSDALTFDCPTCGCAVEAAAFSWHTERCFVQTQVTMHHLNPEEPVEGYVTDACMQPVRLRLPVDDPAACLATCQAATGAFAFAGREVNALHAHAATPATPAALHWAHVRVVLAADVRAATPSQAQVDAAWHLLAPTPSDDLHGGSAAAADCPGLGGGGDGTDFVSALFVSQDVLHVLTETGTLTGAVGDALHARLRAAMHAGVAHTAVTAAVPLNMAPATVDVPLPVPLSPTPTPPTTTSSQLVPCVAAAVAHAAASHRGRRHDSLPATAAAAAAMRRSFVEGAAPRLATVRAQWPGVQRQLVLEWTGLVHKLETLCGCSGVSGPTAMTTHRRVNATSK